MLFEFDAAAWKTTRGLCNQHSRIFNTASTIQNSWNIHKRIANIRISVFENATQSYGARPNFIPLLWLIPETGQIAFNHLKPAQKSFQLVFWPSKQFQ